jgi:hypothetical protein
LTGQRAGHLEGAVALDVEEEDISGDLVVAPDVDLWHGQATKKLQTIVYSNLSFLNFEAMP